MAAMCHIAVTSENGKEKKRLSSLVLRRNQTGNFFSCDSRGLCGQHLVDFYALQRKQLAGEIKCCYIESCLIVFKSCYKRQVMCVIAELAGQ